VHTGFLLEKHEGKTPLVGAKHRWCDKVKMHPQELWLQGVNYIHPVQVRDRWWSCEYSNEPSGTVIC
jgi:hypothetical protein